MKVLVILHLYYEQQLGWFLDKLAHVHGCDWDLLLTGPSFSDATVTTVSAFRPDARFLVCENVGYDVWPFLRVFQEINPDDYDWVLKLHTKGNTGSHKIRINGTHLTGFMWRDILVDALLADDARWDEVLSACARPDCGMVCSRKLYARLGFREDHSLLDDELARIGLQTEERRFCIGTMFMLRCSLLKALPLQDFRAEQFPRESASNSGGTLAHTYERVLSLLAPAQGYTVVTTGSNAAYERKQRIRRITKPLLSFLFSIDRKGEDERKYLTVLGIQIPLSK